MGRHFATPGDALSHLELFTAGRDALCHLCRAASRWSSTTGPGGCCWPKRCAASPTYLRAKAALYNPDTEGPAAFRSLIDAHAALVDRLQAARDAIFSRRSHPVQKKRIDTLIALLDAFETMLSSDADFELLRRSRRRDLKWRINAFILLIAEEVEGLTLALRSRHAHVVPHPHKAEDAELIDAVQRGQWRGAGRRSHRPRLFSSPPTSW